VDERGGLEGVTLHFAPEDTVGRLPKLLIHKGKEPVEGFPVAAPQLIKKS
jgi:hypothetical protein